VRRIPSFVLLRTFEAAARLESFSAAAAELHLTPSAVSHQIKELEAYLERPLFERMHRRVTCTPDGAQFARSLASSFDAIEQAWQELLSPGEHQDLVVHCAPSFATNWLGPRIRKLVDTYPQMRLTILSDAEPLDLVKRREVDVVISYVSYIQREDVLTFSVGLDEFVPMCSPALRERFASDEDTILHSVPIESRGSCIPWSTWYRLNELPQPSTAPITFDRLSMKISAAVDGLGIVLEASALAEQELAAGRLVKLDKMRSGPILRDAHFVSVRKRDVETWKVKAFIAWIREERARASHPLD
jgi:LysR family transcriptional regulator, glycine cleavage system transcriptional activator